MNKFAVFLLTFPGFAFAQEVDPNLNQVLDQVVLNFGAGKTVGAVAGIVLILVFLFRKYALPKLKLGNGVLPLLSLLLGALLSALSSVVAGVPVTEAAMAMMFSGPTAISIWDSIFKLMAKKE